MKNLRIFILSFAVLPFVSCSQNLKDLTKNFPEINTSPVSSAPTNDEVISGLKEALNIGISKGADLVSQPNGYFGNTLIKIMMPQDAKNVEEKLRELGFGQQVDNAILTMNRAAEDAALKAKPIFVNAIKQMSISDAMGILKGANNAATEYLKQATTTQLTTAFKPVIQQSLDKVDATKYWKQVFDTYNKIPFVKQVNSDLTGYVTQKALDGLFYQIAQQEAKIRSNPKEQVTELLKKVFGKKN